MVAAAAEGADGATCIIRCFITFSALSHKEGLESRGERGSCCRWRRCEESQVAALLPCQAVASLSAGLRKCLCLWEGLCPPVLESARLHWEAQGSGASWIPSKAPGRFGSQANLQMYPCHDQPGILFLISSQRKLRPVIKSAEKIQSVSSIGLGLGSEGARGFILLVCVLHKLKEQTSPTEQLFRFFL